VGKTQQTGKTGARRPRRTYTDGAYYAKGSSVCKHMVFGADRFERQVLEQILSIACENQVEAKVIKILESAIDVDGSKLKNQMDETNAALRSMSERIASLIAIAESGIRLGEVTDRLRELEESKGRMEEKKKNLEIVKSERKEMQLWAELVAEFFRNFESRFLDAPMAEQKVLLRKLIHKIIIDRDRNVGYCISGSSP